MMSTSNQISGRCVPTIAETIILMCTRTWNQERRIGVLLRTIKTPLSVWDCIPEQIFDAHLKDAFEYLPKQRYYILFHATPGSAVVRSIRRLDGYRATPLVLRSLHFAKGKDIHAYKFPQELSSTPDFSDAEAGEDSAIPREWTPLPEFEDSEIQTTVHDDASKLEDDVVYGKPQQWTEYSETEDVENCMTPPQSVSDLEDKALSPELRRISPVHKIHREIDHENPDDESLNTDNSKSRELFTLYECDEGFDDDQQGDEPLKADSPEPLQLSPMNQYHTDFDDDQQDNGSLQIESPESQQFFPSRHEFPILEFVDYEEDDKSLEGDSPEPRRLFPVNQVHSALHNPPQPDLQTETWCPAPLRRFLTPGGILELDLFEDWFLHMSEGASIDAKPEKYTSKTYSPEPGNKLFPLGEESPVPENAGDEKDDESLEADSPEPRRLFPVHQSHPAKYDPPQLAPQMGILCPIPIREHATHKVILQPELFEDWFVDMSEPVFIDEEAISPDKYISGTPSPETQKFFMFDMNPPTQKLTINHKMARHLRHSR